MIEIHPIVPSSPIVKPKKIVRDDNHPPPHKQRDSSPAPKSQEPDSIQHIDEIV